MRTRCKELLLSGFLIVCTVLIAPANSKSTVKTDRARLIVLADMGNEPDEEQQMIHLLMCSSEFDVEGLIAVSGKFLRPESKEVYKQTLHPELFYRLIDGYEKVYPNLKLHCEGWQTPEYLRSIVSTGQIGYGVAATGRGKSSPGSELIIKAVSKADPRPVHIVINAGSNSLAQALIDFRTSHTLAEVNAFVSKIRVYENQAQDDAGAWICHEFTNIFWIRSLNQTRCFGGSGDKNMGPCNWKPYTYTPEGQHEWAQENIMTNHGALGELYPKRIYASKLHVIEGGGTIPWLNLVTHGLTDTSEPTWGGWSGRFSGEKILNVPSPYADVTAEEQKSIPYSLFTDKGIVDNWTDPEDGKVYNDPFTPIYHWRTAMWNDLKTRMEWCVQPFGKANHYPHAVINGNSGDDILRISAKPGDVLKFTSSGSADPDKDPLRYLWWIYPEAGRTPYNKELPIKHSTSKNIRLTIPMDAAGKELHLILEVWDKGKFAPLADYRRVVISVGLQKF